MEYKQIAETCFAYGLTAIPCDEKVPLKKSGYRDLIKPNEIIVPDYGTPNGLAILCGSLSSGFMCIDFDLKNGDGEDFFEAYIDLLKEDNPRLYNLITCSRTPSGGAHIYVMVDNPPPSAKLAQTDSKKDLIETRGEGGYCLIPPSKGYTWRKGGLDTLCKISQEDWKYMVSLARCYNEYVPDDTPEYTPKNTQISADSPLNKYDAEADPRELLEDLGYRVIRSNSTQIHFNRPNARNKHGVDATVYTDKKHIHFWSPVSNANLPDTDRNYKPSQFLVFTRYNGDFSAAAKDLSNKYSLETVVENNATTVKPIVPQVELKGPVEGLKTRQVNFRMEVWAEENNRNGVNLTEDLMQSAYDTFFDLNKDEVREFMVNYYRDNQDFFGINQVKNPFERLERYITGNFIIRRNVVDFSTDIVKKMTGEVTGFDENSIWNLCKKAGYKCAMADIKSILNDPRYYTIYDPFREYFTELAKSHTPSDLSAISKLASYVSVAPEIEDFWQTMFRKALIRSVAAAVGGYVNREAIVLCDPRERAGKTSFVRFLNPWGEKQYFCDEPIVGHKDQMFRICQNFVYLIDEIGSERYNHKTMDYLKLILSKSSVNERKVYAVDTSHHDRKVSFWGTTNLPYLSVGENTRWISIPISYINHNYHNYITGHAEVSIHDVWFEAYKAYLSGESFELTPRERDVQETLNKDWIIGNEAGGLVDAYVTVDDESSWRTPEEIVHLLGVVNQNLARRVAAKNIKEALMSRKVEYKYAKTALGHKAHLFYCTVKPHFT